MLHSIVPHTDTALYGCTMACALAFAVVGSIMSMRRHRRISGMMAIAQAGSGASFPVFILLPLVPYDPDILEALTENSWVTVALAGLIGAGAAIYSLWHHPGGKTENGVEAGW